MKPNLFAISASAILATAMLSHGQTQTDQRTGVTGAATDRSTATGGDPATGQSTATDGAAAPGESTVRGQSPAPGEPGATGRQDTDRSTTATEESATSSQGMTTIQPNNEGQLTYSEAERARRATEKLSMDWSDAEEREEQLSNVPERVRNTLTTVADEGQIEDKIVVRTKDGHTVYCATIERSNEENLKIFVQPDGTVVKTKQKVDFSDAPQAVQTVFRNKAGGDQDSQPQQLHRIIADDQTFYTAAGNKEDKKKGGDKLIVDNSGRAIDHLASREGASGSDDQGATAGDARSRARREAQDRRNRDADSPRSQEGQRIQEEELGSGGSPRPQD